ncbi:MAG: IPT/TIG domain-containing protein [Polyangiales bacterium]
MTTPVIVSIDPPDGPSGGGALATLSARGIGDGVLVRFGGADAVVVSVRPAGDTSIVELRTPPHAEGVVDVTLVNVGDAGTSVAGESTTAARAYTFRRPRIVRQSDLTRLDRALLRELKRQVIENVSLSVALDFGDESPSSPDGVPIAAFPSLVVTGPHIRENRVYSTNELREDFVVGQSGPEIRRSRPACTVDVEFALTGASDRAVELLNLTAALGTFFNRNRWIEMDRDPDEASRGVVRWELDALGELQTSLDGKDDVRSFSWGCVVRAFDLDEGLPFETAREVLAPTTRFIGGVP